MILRLTANRLSLWTPWPTRRRPSCEILLARRTLAPEMHDAKARALSVHLDALIDAGDTVGLRAVRHGTQLATLLDSVLRRGVQYGSSRPP